MIENIKFTARLSTEYKLKAADRLISSLRIQLGQEKEYVDELEETVASLRKEIADLEKSLEKEHNQMLNDRKKYADKYSKDVQQAVKLDDVYIRQEKEIKELKESNKQLIANRDKLIAELLKYNK